MGAFGFMDFPFGLHPLAAFLLPQSRRLTVARLSVRKGKRSDDELRLAAIDS